jgi:DNA-binding transcriptional LysR family regulator
MRLRHIEVFHAIMQVGTISGAAQVLHISQPAVTKVLQHAELQLGMPLFERVRGKLYPRPEAHRLFVETEKLHRDLQGIRRLAASLKGRAVETVRLVSTPTIAVSVLPAGPRTTRAKSSMHCAWAKPMWACPCRTRAIPASWPSRSRTAC